MELLGIREPVGAVLSRQAEARPDTTCCAMGGTTYTFGEMDALSDALAGGMANLGVGKGDRVATLATNRPELLECFYGLAKAGAIQVPLNAYIKGAFLRHQLEQSRAQVVITDSAGREALEPLRSQLPHLRTVIALDFPVGEEVAYGAVRALGTSAPDVTITAHDPISIVYTSGTTGLPKGCVASHGYYCRCADVLGTALEVEDEDVVFSGLPLFHSGARLVTVTLPLLFGVPTHFQSTFSASRFVSDARDVGATLAVAVGAMGAAILATEPSDADRDHHVRRIMCAPLNRAAQDQYRERFSMEPWVDIFGQTECMPVTATQLSSDDRDPDGCGVAAPDLEVALLDDEGAVVEGEGTGELCARPKQPHATFDGYFDRPQDTLDAMKGLWYHTGDYAKRLPSGAFAFVDRKKDALRRRGENVSSLELEAAIATHPEIKECAVHAYPSELGEDDVKVCLVASDGAAPGASELFDFFKSQLPYFAIPRYVDVLDDLPRNGVGRVMKNKLRDAGNTADTIDFEALGLTVARDERR